MRSGLLWLCDCATLEQDIEKATKRYQVRFLGEKPNICYMKNPPKKTVAGLELKEDDKLGNYIWLVKED